MNIFSFKTGYSTLFHLFFYVFRIFFTTSQNRPSFLLNLHNENRLFFQIDREIDKSISFLYNGSNTEQGGIMKRILVEFYSHRTPENLISILKERFDGVLFLYFQTKDPPREAVKTQLKNVIRDLCGFFPVFVPLPHPSIQAALDAMENFIGEGNECEYVFDITGGNELFIAAAGYFLAKHPQIPIRLQQYDVITEEPVDQFPSGLKNPLPPLPAALNADQIISLNGTKPILSFTPNYSFGPLRDEVVRLWNAVKHHLKEWNDFFSFSADDSGEKDSMKQKKLEHGNTKNRSYFVIAEDLKRAGIMEHERQFRKGNKTYVQFDLNVVPEAEFLFKKGGNLLEAYMALAAFDAGLFSDIRIGMILDWDGIVSPHEQKSDEKEPHNEIDVVLVKDNFPIFASCKNTVPKKDHLYEITVMANHYGGYYATPVLFSTWGATAAVKERATEMGVVLIDNIRRLSLPELVKLIRRSFSSTPS